MGTQDHRQVHHLAAQRYRAARGGIHGAAVFRQLAAAGLRIALVEQNDFGSGTSANSLKILHSGLRYLQHLNFKRIRESIRSAVNSCGCVAQDGFEMASRSA